MPLKETALREGLENLPISSTIIDASKAFAEVLVVYFRDGNAGDTLPVVLEADPLVSILQESMLKQRFIEELGTSIQSWALTWSWASTNFTAAIGTTQANGSVLDSLLEAFTVKTILDRSKPIKNNLPELSQIIHSWVRGGNLNVTLTNNSSGSTIVVPIT